jgi:mannonate dehydratase
MVYGHANGKDIEQTVDEVLRHKEMGYMAIRAQSGVPGLDKVYGVGKGTVFYEPADADLPSEHDWSTEKYLRTRPKLFEAVREAVGLTRICCTMCTTA